jgi:hypothetical protein
MIPRNFPIKHTFKKSNADPENFKHKLINCRATKAAETTPEQPQLRGPPSGEGSDEQGLNVLFVESFSSVDGGRCPFEKASSSDVTGEENGMLLSGLYESVLSISQTVLFANAAIMVEYCHWLGSYTHGIECALSAFPWALSSSVGLRALSQNILKPIQRHLIK